MNEIEKYYNKFNEDKRLKTRHGQVEFLTSCDFILKYLKQGDKICDVGAGTGAYSKFLSEKGFDVTAVELVKKNVRVIEEKCPNIKVFNKDARNLKCFKDETFDFVILFGPMYHLFTTEEKVRALNEAKRITKKGGYIFVAYLLCDYAVVLHGFMDNNIRESLNSGKLDENFNIISDEKDLYSYVKLEDIKNYTNLSGLTLEKIFSPDGPTDYIRKYVNNLSEEDFKLYLNYVKNNALREDLLGASSHVVSILKK